MTFSHFRIWLYHFVAKAETQSESVSDRYIHLSENDDLNDDNPRLVASAKFVSARDKFDSLMQVTLQAWIVLLVVAVLMWVYLRWSYARLVEAWHKETFATTKDEIADDWADSRRSLWRARRQILVLKRDAYTDVAKPLELFVLIFIFFGLPVRDHTSRNISLPLFFSSFDRSELISYALYRLS